MENLDKFITELENFVSEPVSQMAKDQIAESIKSKGFNYVYSQFSYLKNHKTASNPLGLLISLLKKDLDYGRKYRIENNRFIKKQADPRKKREFVRSDCDTCGGSGMVTAHKIHEYGQAPYAFRCDCKAGSNYNSKYFITWDEMKFSSFCLDPADVIIPPEMSPEAKSEVQNENE